jgi:hypothetical protein
MEPGSARPPAVGPLFQASWCTIILYLLRMQKPKVLYPVFYVQDVRELLKQKQRERERDRERQRERDRDREIEIEREREREREREKEESLCGHSC